MGLKKEKRKAKKQLHHHVDTLLTLKHELARLKRMQLEDTATMEVFLAVLPLVREKIRRLKTKLAKIEKEQKSKRK